MTATQTSNNNNSKSAAIKLLSVVGLTIFTGFYANSWQRSLSKHYAEQKQQETQVASAAPTATQEQETLMAMAEVEETTETVAVAREVISEPEAVEIAPEITDRTTINSLNGELYQTIDATWRQIPSFTENLVYKVKVTKEGAIAQYEHINKAALDHIQETPLPNLTNKETAATPTAEFLVVLAPTGTLQVSPWVGK